MSRSEKIKEGFKANGFGDMDFFEAEPSPHMFVFDLTFFRKSKTPRLVLHTSQWRRGGDVLDR